MKDKVTKIGKRLLGGDRRVRWWVLLGVAGILLIGLSEWLPDRKTGKKADATVTVSAAQVEQALEDRIVTLLSAVNGVGECRAMVTLESTSRAVYAASSTVDGDGTRAEDVLTVDTAEGPVGLLLTTLPPSVKGVAVVCSGGENPAICQQVVQIVATAFHISERRVCVAALK